MLVTVASYIVYDVSREAAYAREYYRANEFHWIPLLIAASVIGVICLAYRDRSSQTERILHGRAVITILAAAMSLLATYLVVRMWNIRDLLQELAIRQRILCVTSPLIICAIAGGLWWQALASVNRHRTMGSRVRSPPGGSRVP